MTASYDQLLELEAKLRTQIRKELEQEYRQKAATPADISDLRSQKDLQDELNWSAVRVGTFLKRNGLEGIPVGPAKMYNRRQVRQALLNENRGVLEYLGVADKVQP